MSKQTIVIQPDGVSAKKCNPYWKIDCPELWAEFEAINPPYPTIGQFEPGLECIGELVRQGSDKESPNVWYMDIDDNNDPYNYRKAWQIETPKAEPTIKEVTVEEMAELKQSEKYDSGFIGNERFHYKQGYIDGYKANTSADYIIPYDKQRKDFTLENWKAVALESEEICKHQSQSILRLSTSTQAERERIVGIIENSLQYKNYPAFFETILNSINKGI